VSVGGRVKPGADSRALRQSSLSPLFPFPLFGQSLKVICDLIQTAHDGRRSGCPSHAPILRHLCAKLGSGPFGERPPRKPAGSGRKPVTFRHQHHPPSRRSEDVQFLVATRIGCAVARPAVDACHAGDLHAIARAETDLDQLHRGH
jgi:hypothetical protein